MSDRSLTHGLDAAGFLILALGAQRAGAGWIALLLVLAAYACFRAMRFHAPAPLLAAAGTLVFSWRHGGTEPMDLGLALALLSLGIGYRAYSHDRGVWWPAASLAAAALVSPSAALWLAVAIAYFLYAARRPWRTLGWLGLVYAFAFGLCAFRSLPVLVTMGTVASPEPLRLSRFLPPFLLPFLLVAGVGLGKMIVYLRRSGGPDHRLLFLAHGALAAVVLGMASPTLGLRADKFAALAALVIAAMGGAIVGSMIPRAPVWHLVAVGLAAAAAMLGGVPSSPGAPLFPPFALQTTSGRVGLALTVATLLLAAAWPWLRRRRAVAAPAPVAIETLECEHESAPVRWGGLLPSALLLILIALGLLSAAR